MKNELKLTILELLAATVGYVYVGGGGGGGGATLGNTHQNQIPTHTLRRTSVHTISSFFIIFAKTHPQGKKSRSEQNRCLGTKVQIFVYLTLSCFYNESNLAVSATVNYIKLARDYVKGLK